MEANGKAVVRVFTAKNGKRCTAVVVHYGNGKEKYLFSEPVTYMQLLNLTPEQFYALGNGDYPIE